MVRVVAGLALPTALSDEVLDSEEDPPRKNDQGGLERMRRRAKALCLQNEDGAYTWKEVDEGTLDIILTGVWSAEFVLRGCRSFECVQGNAGYCGGNFGRGGAFRQDGKRAHWKETV